MAKAAKPENSSEPKGEDLKLSKASVVMLSKLFTELGAFGFIIVFSALFLLYYGSEEQKKEFVNNFLLLHILRGDKTYLYFLFVCIVSLCAITIFYYVSRLNLKKKEVDLKDNTISHLTKRVSELEGKLDKIYAKK